MKNMAHQVITELSFRGRIVSILHILSETLLCSILLAFISKSLIILIVIIYIMKHLLLVIVITDLQADN